MIFSDARTQQRPLRGCIVLAVALLLSACTSATTPAPSASPTIDEPVSIQPAWYTEEERDAFGKGSLQWLAGWFAPEALDQVFISDLEARWWPTTLAPAATAPQRAAAAFALLSDPGPDDLVNPLQGITLVLLGAEQDGDTLTLDFAHGITATDSMDVRTAQAAQAQLRGMAANYFPDASQLVVTVNGQASGTLFAGQDWNRAYALDD